MNEDKNIPLEEEENNAGASPHYFTCPLYLAWRRKFIRDLEAQYKGGKADGS